LKRVALAVALALAGVLGVWWAVESAGRKNRVPSRIEPTGRPTSPDAGPLLEGDPSRASRPPPAPGSPRWAVHGRVVDDQGVPVAGSELTLSDLRTKTPHRERVHQATNDEGQFQFSDVGTGTYTLRLSGKGRETLEREVRVLDADVTGIEFVVVSGRTLEVLVEADELPASGLGVSVLDADGVNRYGVPDARGRVVFVVPEGRTHIALNHFPAGWLRGPASRGREVRVAAEPTSVRLSLVRADSVTGFVLRRDGQPLAGAVLWFRPGDDASAGSGETGAFHLTVRPGTVGDVVCEDVMERPRQPRSRVAFYGIARGVRAGATGVLVEVDEVARDRKLAVLVRDPEGAPALGVSVRASISGSEEPRSARTDPSGHATLTKLPARPVHVSVDDWRILESAWLPPVEAWVVPDGQEVAFDLRRGARLTGRITGPVGPILNASIEAWRADAAVAFALSDAEGNFGLTIDPVKHLPLLICARLGKRYSAVTLQVDRLPTAPLELHVPER
jgi:hypothetical protein